MKKIVIAIFLVVFLFLLYILNPTGMTTGTDKKIEGSTKKAQREKRTFIIGSVNITSGSLIILERNYSSE